MLRAEDWDLNFRIRTGGGVIWFTPDLHVTYRPRASVRTLAAQYFHYGRWRRVIVREHPETASFRYLAPPGAAGLVAVGLAAGLAGLGARAGGAPGGPGRGGTGGRPGRPGRAGGRGAVRPGLADGRLRDPRHVPGRDHGGRP